MCRYFTEKLHKNVIKNISPIVFYHIMLHCPENCKIFLFAFYVSKTSKLTQKKKNTLQKSFKCTYGRTQQTHRHYRIVHENINYSARVETQF